MKKTREYMIGYLLSFCRTWDERNEQEARLEALTDEALREEFTAEYTALEGNCPKSPLYEDEYPDIYPDFD